MQVLTRFNKVIAYDELGFVPVGNSAVCISTDECYCDALIVNVDCVPTDVDLYDYYYVDGKFIKGDAKPRLNEGLYTLEVYEAGPSHPVKRGELNCTISGGTVHIFGSITLEPKVTGTIVETRELMLDGVGFYLVGPPSKIYTPQLMTGKYAPDNYGSGNTIVYTAMEYNTLTILELPVSEYVINHIVYVNITYNALGVKGIV